MRNRHTIWIITLMMLVGCTKENTTSLSFTYDGKPERFEKVEAIYFLNCGITPTWRVHVEQGDRFFRIEWTQQAGSFWYTYKGKSFAEAIKVDGHRFAGSNVKDGLINVKFIQL